MGNVTAMAGAPLRSSRSANSVMYDSMGSRSGCGKSSWAKVNSRMPTRHSLPYQIRNVTRSGSRRNLESTPSPPRADTYNHGLEIRVTRCPFVYFLVVGIVRRCSRRALALPPLGPRLVRSRAITLRTLVGLVTRGFVRSVDYTAAGYGWLHPAAVQRVKNLCSHG